METRSTSALSREIRTLWTAGAFGNLPDGRLLERFLATGDEAAFAALVDRHGPMVWNVCRRVLRNHHDAEDAFQATFLVLARRAATIQGREAVGHWLYGVAFQTARKAQAMTSKRRQRESLVPPPEPGKASPDLWPDLEPVLDEELNRLPARYRAPIVLCDLQGKTRKQAARELGWPEGTLSSRLSRARASLARRLARRGLGVSGGLLGALISARAASARMPVVLADSTVQAATLFATGQAVRAALHSARSAALAHAVLRGLILGRMRFAIALGASLLGLVAVAQGVRTGPAQAAGAGADDQPRSSPPTLATAKSDPRLQGIWFGSIVEFGGTTLPADANQASRLSRAFRERGQEGLLPLLDRVPPLVEFSIGGNHLAARGPEFGNVVRFGPPVDSRFSLKPDASKTPKTLDLTLLPRQADSKPIIYTGIYSATPNELIICLSLPSESRPLSFKTTAGSSQMLFILKHPVLHDVPLKARPTNPRQR